ncbi:MAG: hypothetical protein IPI57_13820 [Candidatus Competibacteraceae bacterium]|nr:hypothetical protein [Candidatus Competibacteraceae bacterium]
MLGVNGTSRHSANLVATYRYRDADGREVRQKVRFEPKDFRIRHQDAAGQWVYKTGDGPAVLYRLPELKAAIKEGKTVFVVEGEKDADKLAALRAGGHHQHRRRGPTQPARQVAGRVHRPASGSRPRGAAARQRRPRRAHMAHIAGQMAGRVADLRILELSGLPEKGDVSDWLKAGHAAEELEALAEGAPRAESKPAKPVQADHHAGAHDPLWRVDLITDDDDKPVKTHYNAVLIAEHAYPGLIGFNEFSGQIEAGRQRLGGPNPAPWIDYDTQELAFHIVKEPHYPVRPSADDARNRRAKPPPAGTGSTPRKSG